MVVYYLLNNILNGHFPHFEVLYLLFFSYSYFCPSIVNMPLVLAGKILHSGFPQDNIHFCGIIPHLSIPSYLNLYFNLTYNFLNRNLKQLIYICLKFLYTETYDFNWLILLPGFSSSTVAGHQDCRPVWNFTQRLEICPNELISP